MLKLVSVHAVLVLLLVHVLVSRLLHVVVLTLLRVVVLKSMCVVVLCAVLLTVMGVMPLRSVHESSLSWACTTLPSEEHQRHRRQRSRHRPSRGRS